MPYKDKEKQREAQRKWEKENRGAAKRLDGLGWQLRTSPEGSSREVRG